MNETYQNRITDQICKIQNDRALIAFYDRLRYAPLGNYAQLHAKGEYQENGHKVHSLICITIQDYSNGTGDRNIITRFNLAPEQIQFLLTRITSGFQEFEWSQSKIYGNPDQNGYSTAQMFYISRHPYDSKGQPMKSPWKIQIVNGKGIKAQNGMLPVKRTIKNNKFLYRQPCYGWRYFMLLLYIAHDISLVSLHAVSFEVVGCCSNLCN